MQFYYNLLNEGICFYQDLLFKGWKTYQWDEPEVITADLPVDEVIHEVTLVVKETGHSRIYTQVFTQEIKLFYSWLSDRLWK